MAKFIQNFKSGLQDKTTTATSICSIIFAICTLTNHTLTQDQQSAIFSIIITITGFVLMWAKDNKG